ncbi:MAG TPA: outer membrane protein assembly factor BamA, partial [Terriglobales bacterium]|nr:outer membrane protein assembly factor BamA [Terriglobales bacterium]
MMLAAFSSFPTGVFAVLLDALDPARAWRVQSIEFSGNHKFSDDDLSAAIVTQPRPWNRFWDERPVLDPVTFETDLERLRRFYESRGYYNTAVTYDLQVDPERDLVAIHIDLREGEQVVVSTVDVEVHADGPMQNPPPLPENLPIKPGDIFNEADYQKAEQALRIFLLDQGYAYVKTERRAEVDLEKRQVRVRYTIQSGPVVQFGATEIKGTETVEPELISRELTYKTGETYSLKKVTESREKLLALDLFSTVKVGPAETTGAPAVVPMVVEVAEKPHHEIKIGVGYGTEDHFRGQLEWRHLNFLGGGRRLSILAKYSSIIQSGSVNFTQPHFLTPETQGVANLSHDQEDEETYLRNVTRLTPRLEHRFSPTLTGFVGYRVEYDNLNDVAGATVQALGGVRRQGLLSGPTIGLVWNTSDDPFDPKRGHVLALALDQAGAIWGGQYSFYKISAEAKKYVDIGWQTVFASRLKLGLADAIGADKNLPLFERFYSGGEKSVRGYGRRRLGPLSASDDPLGGLSLIEGSLELRRPIWKELNGAVFIDFGQVSTKRFDIPIGDLQFSRGFGVSYATPVGP